MAKFIKSITVAAAAAALLLSSGIIAYTLDNESGHTGIDPYLALVVFVPAAVTGVIQLALSGSLGLPRWPGLAAVFFSVFGIGLLVYLDVSNTLLQYEVWVSRGLM